MENNFYVYMYLREDGTPYYVGKGRGKRAYQKARRLTPTPKDKSRIAFYKQNLTEEEAFKHEIELIALYGRKDLGTGILLNFTNGGEGASGFNHSEESKIKIAEASTGRTFSEETKRKISERLKGKIVSEETRKKLSEIAKARKSRPCSEETKRKMSGILKGRIISEETKRKMSESKKGKPGHPHSEETKAKLREVKKGTIISEETKRKTSESVKEYYRKKRMEKMSSECVDLEKFFE